MTIKPIVKKAENEDNSENGKRLNPSHFERTHKSTGRSKREKNVSTTQTKKQPPGTSGTLPNAKLSSKTHQQPQQPQQSQTSGNGSSIGSVEQKVLAECDNNVKIESSGINNGGQVKVEAILERLEEQLSGYNSGDEHLGQKETSVTSDEWKKRDDTFETALGNDRKLIIKNMEEDGACLFRAISYQIYGDQGMHETIRQQTMDYIQKNREYFAQFVTEDITKYVSRKRENHVHGNHIEIQAMSEMYNRPVELYCYEMTPINIYNSEQMNNGYDPLRLSYQRCSHYNAILDPFKGSVGVGLGLPGYRPEDFDPTKQFNKAVELSEQLEIEQTMFEDKLKTTDWEATTDVVVEQIARESYLQWCKDNASKPLGLLGPKNGGKSTSTITSTEVSPSSSATSASSTTQISQPAQTSPASSSNSRDNENENTNPYSVEYFMQHQMQHQKQRKKRHHNQGIEKRKLDELSKVELPATVTPKRSKRASPTPPSTSTSPAAASDSLIKISEPLSAFYQSLLESSYSDDGKGSGQLSEREMLQKALEVSAMDFIKGRFSDDEYE